jgi:hypothetical protein
MLLTMRSNISHFIEVLAAAAATVRKKSDRDKAKGRYFISRWLSTLVNPLDVVAVAVLVFNGSDA